METVRISDLGVDSVAAKAALVLAEGGIVLYPTDTLYGLAVDAANADAMRRLYALKGREEGKSLSVAVADLAAMERIALREHCPFCRENLALEHKQPILTRNAEHFKRIAKLMVYDY